MKAESVIGKILLPVYESFTKLAFHAIKAVSTKKNTRIKMRLDNMNLENLFHMGSGLDKEKALAAKVRISLFRSLVN